METKSLNEIKKLLSTYDEYKYNTPNDEKRQSIMKELETLSGILSAEKKVKQPKKYKPYPDITSDTFYEDLLSKTEISKNKVMSPNTKPCENSKFSLTSNQKFLRTYMSPYTPYNGILLYHGVGVGKCFAPDTRILMFNNTWKKVQDVCIGDIIMGDDSLPRNVLNTVRGNAPMYRIMPEFGEPYTVNCSHILCFKRKSDGSKLDISVVDYLRLSEHDQYDLYGYRANIVFTIATKIDLNKDKSINAFVSDPAMIRQYGKNYTLFNYDLSDYPIDIRYIYLSTVLLYNADISLCGDYIQIPYTSGIYNTMLSIGVGCKRYFGDTLYLFGQNLKWFSSYLPCLTENIASRSTLFKIYIHAIGQGDYYGFEVDDNHRFIIQDYIVTHNSCSAITIAETLNYPRKPLILLPSSLKDNFKQQIFDISKGESQCTGKKYVNMLRNIGDSDEASRANTLIKNRYDIYGFLEFANTLRDMKEKDTTKYKQSYRNYINDHFSNRVLIIDEAHNIRTGTNEETVKKIVPPILNDVIEYADNIKLILLTATPMFNSVEEIVWLLNLLLLNDRREQISVADIFKNKVLTEKGKDILKRSAKGYVSYMRGETPYAFPVRLWAKRKASGRTGDIPPTHDYRGEKIDTEDKLKYTFPLVYSELSNKHAEYLKGFINENTNNFMNSHLQATNAFFDDDVNKKNIVDNLEEYAPKIATILNYVRNAKGIVFIYSYFLEYGIDIIAKALEHQLGYMKYNKTGSNPPGKSYIILSGNKETSSDSTHEIGISKSFENKDGDLVKVIIGSSVATEGVDFKNIREVHILEPWHHMNKIEQTIGRAVRYCSHISLPIEKRNTTIYLHCTCYKTKIGKSSSKIIETPDEHVYRKAQNKHIEMQAVDTIIKQGAVDCYLNKNVLHFSKASVKANLKEDSTFDLVNSQGEIKKNYIMGDGDDYVTHKCDYVGHADKVDDDSTVQKSLFIEEINDMITKIVKLYDSKKVIGLSYEEIADNVLGDNDILAYALNEMLLKRTTIKERGYLIYRSNQYIYQPFTDSRLHSTLASRYTIPSTLKIDNDGVVSGKDDDSKNDITKYVLDTVSGIFETIYDNSRVEESDTSSRIWNKKEKNIFVSEFEDVVIDHVIDGIQERDMLLELAHTVNNQKIERSLKTGYILVSKKDNLYRDIINNEIVVYNSDTGIFDKITSLEMKLHSAKINDSLPILLSTKLKGFTVHYKGESKFKLLEDNKISDGYVCKSTATLKVNDLFEMVNTTFKKELKFSLSNNSETKVKKDLLCLMHELLLRKYSPSEYARVYHWTYKKLIEKQEKKDAKLQLVSKKAVGTRKVRKAAHHSP